MLKLAAAHVAVFTAVAMLGACGQAGSNPPQTPEQRPADLGKSIEEAENDPRIAAEDMKLRVNALHLMLNQEKSLASEGK